MAVLAGFLAGPFTTRANDQVLSKESPVALSADSPEALSRLEFLEIMKNAPQHQTRPR